jgi:uncharacterized membrane protein
MEIIDFIFRWLHVIFGIVWIGHLYYFNFVQTEYFKEAEASAKADAVQKLAPRALWWFRWGAMFTFLTGVVLLVLVFHAHGINAFLIVGAVLGTLMFLNVWLIIWPNQQIVCGLKEGDAAAAAPKAGLASRTNTLFSTPMLLGMIAGAHGGAFGAAAMPLLPAAGTAGIGFWLVLLIIALLQANAIWGKTGPMTSVKGVIHSSIGLSIVFALLLSLLP